MEQKKELYKKSCHWLLRILKGGLNMIDIHSMFKALRIKWIVRLNKSILHGKYFLITLQENMVDNFYFIATLTKKIVQN